MSRRTQSMLGVAALILALGAGAFVYLFFGRLATMATVPVPASPIPAGALISPDLLTAREVPRTLLEEPIYTDAADLSGRVAQVPLVPDVVVFRHQAVPLHDYRLVDDPELVVVSLPVDPARAVGGQVQPGHRVDVWRLPRGQEETSVTSTLILTDVLVVDVRANQGQAVSRRPQAVPGQLEPEEQTRSVPLQILTVAVEAPASTSLFDLLAEEESGRATLWIALAPLVRHPPATYVRASVPTSPVGQAEPTPAPSPTPLPTATPPSITAVVTKTGGNALIVRAAPVDGEILARVQEGVIVTIIGRTSAPDTEGDLWYQIEGESVEGGPVIGWVSGRYLEGEGVE